MRAAIRPVTSPGVLAVLAVAMLVPASAQAASADLAITKSDSPDPVQEGAVLTYAITVTNLGPATANAVTVTDILDSHMDFISATSSEGSCNQKGRKVTCTLGALDPYTPSASITISVRPKKAGQIANTATVALGGADTDPNPANNSATQTTTVVAAGGGGGGGGPTCSGRRATVVGTGGSETLQGTSGRDVIKARGGKDTIRGLQGKDVVCAGGGNDLVRGGGGNDRLKGGAGKDVLKGGGGSDSLLGGPGRDQCRGGPGSDTKRSC